MKKEIFTILALLSIGLVGCKDKSNNQSGNTHQNEEHYVHGDNGEAHTEHIYSDTWVANPQAHLHPCIYENCHHYADVEPHTFIIQCNETEHWEVCSVCGYEKRNSRQPHVFEEIINDDYRVPGSTTATGTSYYKSCSCGYSNNEIFTDNSNYFGINIESSEHGHVHLRSNQTLFKVGSEVEFILVADEGYYPDKLIVNGETIDQNCDNVYKVNMPEGGLTIKGVFTEGFETFTETLYFTPEHASESNGYYNEYFYTDKNNIDFLIFDELHYYDLCDDCVYTDASIHQCGNFISPVVSTTLVFHSETLENGYYDPHDDMDYAGQILINAKDYNTYYLVDNCDNYLSNYCTPCDQGLALTLNFDTPLDTTFSFENTATQGEKIYIYSWAFECVFTNYVTSLVI